MLGDSRSAADAEAAQHAFCGFYVAGHRAPKLFNDATQVVLMRKGTRTVLSMQNNYQGPPEDFAMVVPVPVVLQEEDVKTLPHGRLRARSTRWARRGSSSTGSRTRARPRSGVRHGARDERRRGGGVADGEQRDGGGDLGVKIEAQFAVGEYQIVILSAKDSTGLDTWLRARSTRSRRAPSRCCGRTSRAA